MSKPQEGFYQQEYFTLIVTLSDDKKYYFNEDLRRFLLITDENEQDIPQYMGNHLHECAKNHNEHVNKKIEEYKEKIRKGFFYDNVRDYVATPIKHVWFEVKSRLTFDHVPDRKIFAKDMQGKQY